MHRTPSLVRMLVLGLALPGVAFYFPLLGCGGDDWAIDSSFAPRQEKIVGGVSTLIDLHPWQISLQDSTGSHFCGGSILNSEWVLTAQHCAVEQTATALQVVAGMTRLSNRTLAQTVTVDDIVRFPGFAVAAQGKDVSLLHLATPIDLTGPRAQAVSLSTAADLAAGLTDAGVIATVTGWGLLASGGESPDTLQTVAIPIVSNAAAQAAYAGQTITADQIGAGIIGTGGVDACQGDSGGPMTVDDGTGGSLLAGVVSWGFGCAEARYPGMYARVSSFSPWIEEVMASVSVPLGSDPSVSATTGVWRHYTVSVPPGALIFTAEIYGPSGDADLYVKFGAQPTPDPDGSYDCRPFRPGSKEVCTVGTPQAGVWHVSVHAFASYSELSVGTAYRILPSLPVEICDDGVDNDGDGAVDCADSDCAADPACAPPPVEICDDGVDNDGDGAVDCADTDCAADPACAPPPVEICDDGMDNDGDGAVDCADPDCVADPVCAPPPVEICDDGMDNDGDGAVDCADPDCVADIACSVNSMCPGGELRGIFSEDSADAVFEYATAASGLYAATIAFDDDELKLKLRLEYRRGSRWRKVKSDKEEISYNSSKTRRYRWRIKHKDGSGPYHLCITSP